MSLEDLVSGNIVFGFEAHYATLDQARQEAKYLRREGYYVRIIKRKGPKPFYVYSARKH